MNVSFYQVVLQVVCANLLRLAGLLVDLMHNSI